MIFKRGIQKRLKEFSKFPVVAILGPRQSGKTTLAKHYFKKYQYYNFEDIATRELALTDPKKFLRLTENKHGVILDEFQYVPNILSDIQIIVDEIKRPGYFVLTGSQNFLMNQAITQSLAGRVGIITLLPLSLSELKANKLIQDKYSSLIFKGSYPRIYDSNLDPNTYFPAYIQTYVERDARQLTHIGDLRTFQKFIALCAGRIGQLLNLSDLAINAGISQPTAKHWLSVLEANYIIFILSPYYNNFNKRFTKTPKLYFYDTGLACNLLGFINENQIELNPLKGALFENFIMADFQKQFFNLGLRPRTFFWRENNQKYEVDCIIDTALKPIPIEIKSGETINNDFFTSLIEWNKIFKTDPENNFVVYAGDVKQERSKGTIIGWKSSINLMEKLIKS